MACAAIGANKPGLVVSLGVSNKSYWVPDSLVLGDRLYQGAMQSFEPIPYRSRIAKSTCFKSPCSPLARFRRVPSEDRAIGAIIWLILEIV